MSRSGAPSAPRALSATELDEFRAEVAAWSASHIPADWRARQTGVSDNEFVAFQRWWFQELRTAGYAVPHWPAEWGGGMSTAEQIVLFQELAAHDAPRLVVAFIGIHHAASTLLVAGTDEQRRRHLPAILDGEIWCQGFSEPDAGSDLASLTTTARRTEGGDGFVVNGQKVWASGARHADWCLLLARTDPDAPKRAGISYFLMDMRSPGIDVRPIRQATGESHFCEVFLDDVEIPASQLVGAENHGWQVAQETLSAERGMTMLELAERLAQGFRGLEDVCDRLGPDGRRPVDDDGVADRLGAFEAELTGLRRLCRGLVERVDAGQAGPADASIVKLYYSELLQRMTRFGTEVVGLATHAQLAKPLSSGWESGIWMLDFVSSWEWTIPGGSSEIQRSIIGERGLGLPREPRGRVTATVADDLAELHDELRALARDLLAGRRGSAGAGQATDGTGGAAGGGPSWSVLADAGWLGLEVPEALDGAGATFAEVAVVLEEMGRAATAGPYLGTAVLGVGALGLLAPEAGRDQLLAQVARGETTVAVASVTGDLGHDLDGLARALPFRLARSGGQNRLDGRAAFVPDAAQGDRLLVLASDPDRRPVVVAVDRQVAGIEVIDQPLLDATRPFGEVRADQVDVADAAVWTFAGDPWDSAIALVDRAALAVTIDGLGLAQAMVEATVEYAKIRHQFGRPIGSFQAVKHACADMAVQLAVSRELVDAAAAQLVTDQLAASAAVSMAKSFVGPAAVDIAGQAMQLHGGIGYTWESGIHTYLKRAALDQSLFGSPQAHRRRLARRWT